MRFKGVLIAALLLLAVYGFAQTTTIRNFPPLLQTTASGPAKALTDAGGAVAYAVVAVPTNGHIGGELVWMASSLSGADQLVANGSVRFWGTDTAGTPVCGINKIGTDGEGHSGGANTLICTWTNVVSATNCALSVTCTNNLAAAQAISLTGTPTLQRSAAISFP